MPTPDLGDGCDGANGAFYCTDESKEEEIFEYIVLLVLWTAAAKLAASASSSAAVFLNRAKRFEAS